MATIQELSAEDFKAFQKDTVASQEYNSLAEDKQKKYEIEYTSKFSNEFKILRSQIMTTEQIDSKSAGQILLKEIRNAHKKGNFLMDPSGNVDRNKFNLVRTTILHDVESGKYDNVIHRNQVAKVVKVNEVENKKIDLNTPEGKKEFIDNLYKGYSECKTLEDKIDYIQDNFGIPFDDMSEEQIDHVINAVGLRNDIMAIEEQLKKQTPDLKDDELETMAEKQYAKDNNQDLETVKAINKDMKALNELLVDKANFKDQKLDISDIDKKITEIVDKLSLSPEELKKIQEENENKEENTQDIKEKKRMEKIDVVNEFESEEIGEEQELFDLFDFDEKQLDNTEGISDLLDIEENEIENNEDISNLFDAEVNELNDDYDTKIEETINGSQINTKVNPIIANVPEEDFEQYYTEEKKENPILKFFKSMRNRLTQKKLNEGQFEKIQYEEDELKQESYIQETKPSFFERAKNILSNLLHKNKETIPQLDTAENNTKTTYEEMKSSFDSSLIVTEEEQAKYKAEYEANKNTKSNSKSNSIEIKDGGVLSI